MELLNDFWNKLTENSKGRSNFQRSSLFHGLRVDNKEEEDKILDFFQYLQNHDIIKVGLDFHLKNADQTPSHD